MLILYQSKSDYFDALSTKKLINYLTPSPEFFSSFPQGTCQLKVPYQSYIILCISTYS